MTHQRWVSCGASFVTISTPCLTSVPLELDEQKLDDILELGEELLDELPGGMS
jgi:hypothetical protein